MVAISFLGALLLMSSLFCFYKALDLIPTDLGLTWLQGGFTLFSAAIIVFAMAFAVRALRTRVPEMAAELKPSHETELSVEPAGRITAAGKAGAILAAGAAAGALAGVAHSAMKDETTAEVGADSKAAPGNNDGGLEDRIIEELERDLFDEAPVPSPVIAHTPGNEPDMALANLLLPEPQIVIPENIAAVIAPAFDPFNDTHAAENAVADVVDADIADVVAEVGIPEAAIEDILEPAAALASEHVMEAPAEEHAITEHVGHAPSGLIADADLAALGSDEPVLAPLETLEVVGAYDSGGSRFTMYSDGSVNTIGPDGERRFRNLEALRAYIDGVTRQ